MVTFIRETHKATNRQISQLTKRSLGLNLGIVPFGKGCQRRALEL